MKLALPFLAALVVFAPGCGDESPPRIANLKPFVRITGGPPEGREDSYTARVWWTGWDEDGAIAHYEYAVDPPEAFSPEEINAPEAFPDIRRRVFRGPEVGQDTLRFEKTLDGEIHRFDYVQTREFSRSFSFTTPHADSSATGSQRLPINRYSGAHRLYVRSFDNEGLYSDVDNLAYTATTRTPSAKITRPILGAQYLTVGSQITLNWDGTDVDSPEAAKKPVGYLYKLVRLEELTPPLSLLTSRNPGYVMYNAAAHIPWIYQSAESTSASFFLDPPAQYMFAVRAVDVAGAVEPFLEFVRAGGPGNSVAFQSISSGGRPSLTVTEPSLGTVNCRGEEAFTFEVPVNKKLNFTWSATAEAYGGTIEAYNWGVNIPDVSREGPGSGWRGWSTLNRNLEPIVFKEPGINSVYIRARDSGGRITTCTLILQVIDFPFDRPILIVDDYRDQVWPRDPEHDAFWMNLLRDSGRFAAEDLDPVDARFDVHGDNDTEFFQPRKPSLETLGRYEMIVFDTKGGGAGGSNGLLLTGPITRHLGAYMGVGGKVWITGEATIASTIPTETGLADFSPTHDIEPGMFAWEYFKIYSARVENVTYDKTNLGGMYSVSPFPGRAEILPQMTLDESKRHPVLRGQYGVGGSDLVFDAIFDQAEPRFRGKIDSLYVYNAYGPTLPVPRTSIYDRRLCAIRWHNPAPDRQQGRVAWFGFPMFYFKNSEAQETFNRMVDWFQEERVGS